MQPHVDVLRLAAVIQVDPDALIRVLQLFSGRNVVPRRVNAQRITVRGTNSEVMQIEIDVGIMDMSSDAIRLVAAKITQMPLALSAIVSNAAAGKTD